MKYFVPILLITWTLLAFGDEVSADRTMRCSGRIVSIGDSTAEVLEKCDEPDRIEQWEEDHNTYVSRIYNFELERYEAPELVKGPIQMERWIYKFGSNRLEHHLLFEREKLIRIESGGINDNQSGSKP